MVPRPETKIDKEKKDVDESKESFYCCILGSVLHVKTHSDSKRLLPTRLTLLPRYFLSVLPFSLWKDKMPPKTSNFMLNTKKEYINK